MKIKHKIYLNLILLAGIILILLFAGISPLLAEIKQLSVDYKQSNNLLASYQEKTGNYFQELEQQYLDLQSEISKIQQAFIDSEKAVEFILKVERLANTTNNYQEIKEISVTENNSKGLTFRISLWGSYPNLIKFLAQLENMDYFVDSNNLQMSSIQEQELRGLENNGIIVSAGDIKSVLEINVYEQKK